ncbi:MAG: D-tyrosyl-tRNA(Tyr) deacylase [Firmicutes bacterium]|jgi:D-tyrosyl-tRNA(Tyr) deacylase|nr:D-tyrosyl-tRNA(Tyr) deacylase [Bacillota bacterium]
MRVIVQRVTHARVRVDTRILGKIGKGMVIFIGVAAGDGPDDIRYLADKIQSLRIFEDESGKMNRSIRETGGSLLCISQFTLFGDCRKGNRPSFTAAARPEVAAGLYLDFCSALKERGLHVETGQFGAMMQVEMENDGPVTIMLDSKKLF